MKLKMKKEDDTRFTSVGSYLLDVRLSIVMFMMSLGDFIRSKTCYAASIISGLFTLLLVLGVVDARILGVTASYIPISVSAIHIGLIVLTVGVCWFVYCCYCLSAKVDEVLELNDAAIEEINNARS